MSSSNEAVTIDVADNLQYVKDKIKASCEECGRSVDDVRLVAVSKTKPLELVQQAYEAGHRRPRGPGRGAHLPSHAGKTQAKDA